MENSAGLEKICMEIVFPEGGFSIRTLKEKDISMKAAIKITNNHETDSQYITRHQLMI